MQPPLLAQIYETLDRVRHLAVSGPPSQETSVAIVEQVCRACYLLDRYLMPDSSSPSRSNQIARALAFHAEGPWGHGSTLSPFIPRAL